MSQGFLSMYELSLLECFHMYPVFGVHDSSHLMRNASQEARGNDAGNDGVAMAMW